MDIPTVASQSIRYGVGLRATAAVATAALIDAGLISQEDPQLVIDKNKVRKAQGKAMKTLSAKFDENIQAGDRGFRQSVLTREEGWIHPCAGSWPSNVGTQ